MDKSNFYAPYAGSTMGYVLVIGKTTAGQVAMVHKNRPSWQAGRLNFPGGKIEAGESPEVAARREFWEETGVDLQSTHLRAVAHLTRPGQFELFAFAAESDLITQVQSITDEAIELVSAQALSQLPESEAIENISWLYGMAFDGHSKCAFIRYD